MVVGTGNGAAAARRRRGEAWRGVLLIGLTERRCVHHFRLREGWRYSSAVRLSTAACCNRSLRAGAQQLRWGSCHDAGAMPLHPLVVRGHYYVNWCRCTTPSGLLRSS